MRIDIVIPTFNEEKVIVQTIETLNGAFERFPEHDWGIIVADNGSSDRTRELITGLRNGSVRVLSIPGRGKGLALREGFATTSADIVGFFDADLSVDPSVIDTALPALLEGKADIVIGSRFHPGSAVDRGMYRSSSSRFFNLLTRTIVGLDHSDTQCGFKMMNVRGKNVFILHQEDGWFFDVEFLARAGRGGLSIAEVPVSWTEFRYADRKSKLKVVRDGIQGVSAMLRIRARLARDRS